MDPDDAPASPPCCLLPCLGLLTGRATSTTHTPSPTPTAASFAAPLSSSGVRSAPHSGGISDGPSDRPRLLQLQQHYTRHHGAACMAHSTLQVRQ